MYYVDRPKDIESIKTLLELFPVVAILGPRQSGKTTLAKRFSPDHVFDLENPRDLIALEQPQLTLENLEGLIMIDEVQRNAALYPLLRYLVDENKNQQFLILGSASSNLRQQSGESLAGRIGYHYLTGFNLAEVGDQNLKSLWLRGGFPKSYLSDNDQKSLIWRTNFITTFLEKDLNILGINVPASTMYRFWLMVSHYHGQTVNYSEIGRSFGISDKTAKLYMSVLEDTFMLRLLMPWHANTGKRLVKKPKLYIRDSGIFHALQSIQDHNALFVSPKAGASWEGFALEELISILDKRDSEVFFYGAHSGVELDAYWEHGGKRFGAEFKYQDAPKATKSMYQAIDDLGLAKLTVIYPGKRNYSLNEKIEVRSLIDLDF
ncbi:MAG: ATP-binding protein [Bacteroidota bacterium]